jgi:molybdopterin-containing oxidoreductase family membrane subunit
VLVLDLGRPDRLMVAMTHFNFKSIFAWNVILYSGFFGIVAAYLWTMMDWKVKPFYKPAAILAFSWRLVLTTGTGSIFGFLVAREAYGQAVMAPLFIAMSFAYGLAVFILVLVASYRLTGRELGTGLINRLGRLLALFCAANLYFVALQHVTALYFAGRGAVEAWVLTGAGGLTLLFWLAQVGLGGVLPMAMGWGTCSHRRVVVPMAAALVILGGIAQVYIIIVGGQSWPLTLFPGMEVSSTFFDGQIHAYSPSLPEIVLGIGGFAIALLVTVVGATVLRFLPEGLAD